jgi:hypothetical protein
VSTRLETMAKGNKNKKSQKQKQQRRPLPVIPRRVQVLDKFQMRMWMPCSSKPKVAANQNIYPITITINETNFPLLAPPMSAHAAYTINSLGARMVTGTTTMPGKHAIRALTPVGFSYANAPTPINLLWMTKQECKVVAISNNANSPPASDPAKTIYRTGSNANVGTLIWVFEGPSEASDRTYLGDFEVYVDISFTGTK